MKFAHSLASISVAILCSTAFTADIIPEDIFAAINLKDTDAVIKMLETDAENSLSMRIGNGITPLHYAASLNRAEIVYRLLNAGVNPNLETDKNLTTPLHWASDKGALDVVRLLIKSGADAQAKAQNGYTALHFMARGTANKDVLKALLESGIPIDATDAHGNTPLHIAAQSGNASAITLLLGAGANDNLKNKAGRYAIELAKDQNTRAALPAKHIVFFPSELPKLPKGTSFKVVESSPTPVLEQPKTAPVQPTTPAPAPTGSPSEAKVTVPITPDLSAAEAYRQLMDDPSAIKNADGSVYKGNLLDNVYHGYGTLCRANRERYQGEWYKGKHHGVGTFSYENGDTYTGAWFRGVPEGRGVFIFANGGKVNGRWDNGILVEGSGTYVGADGQEFQAIWRDGKLVNSQAIN